MRYAFEESDQLVQGLFPVAKAILTGHIHLRKSKVRAVRYKNGVIPKTFAALRGQVDEKNHYPAEYSAE